MILVDIQIPILNKVYDFELNEDMEIDGLIKEIEELAAGKEGLEMPEEPMYLYAPALEKILQRKKTLKQEGVLAGDRLLLL